MPAALSFIAGKPAPTRNGVYVEYAVICGSELARDYRLSVSLTVVDAPNQATPPLACCSRCTCKSGSMFSAAAS